MRHVGTYVHQVADALAALPFGIALEQFAYLEEQHDEDSLGKLRLSSRQETDGECPQRGYRHEEMLVEGIALQQALSGLFQRVVTHQQVGNQVDEQQLPGGQREVLLDDDCRNQ